MKIKGFQMFVFIALLVMYLIIGMLWSSHKTTMEALVSQQTTLRYMSITQTEFSDLFIKLFEQDNELMKIINGEE